MRTYLYYCPLSLQRTRQQQFVSEAHGIVSPLAVTTAITSFCYKGCV